MGSKKKYFAIQDGQDISDAEIVGTVDYWEKIMKEDDIEKLTLYPAQIERKSPAFWCKFHDEISEKGQDHCGKECDGYSPRNGKSGICKHYRNPYIPRDGEKIVLTLNDMNNG